MKLFTQVPLNLSTGTPPGSTPPELKTSVVGFIASKPIPDSHSLDIQLCMLFSYPHPSHSRRVYFFVVLGFLQNEQKDNENRTKRKGYREKGEMKRE
jgi:hypothetical protein